MGLFDFFRRKQPRPIGGEGLLGEQMMLQQLEMIEKRALSGPSPEYIFAHRALREIAMSDPRGFLAMVVSPDASRFIDAVLKDVAEQCGREASFDAGSVEIHPLRVKNYPCAVIKLPEPKSMCEAFMVALVATIDLSSAQPPNIGTGRGRYFTLEKGETCFGEARTVLAEWDGPGRLNYGDVPPADVIAFVHASSNHI